MRGIPPLLVEVIILSKILSSVLKILESIEQVPDATKVIGKLQRLSEVKMKLSVFTFQIIFSWELFFNY